MATPKYDSMPEYREALSERGEEAMVDAGFH